MKRTMCLVLSLGMILGMIVKMPVRSYAASESDLMFTATDGGESYIVSYCDESAEGEIIIPSAYCGKAVTGIGEFAFRSCYAITSVVIPDTVTKIAPDAFFECTSLVSIAVGTLNEKYSSFDGILFDKGKTQLVMYPAGKGGTSYTVPDGVAGISAYAFCNASSLNEVTIPESVISVGDNAFRYCYYLTDIYYGGSEDDWNKIAVGRGNEYLINASIHYGKCEHEYSNWITDKQPTCIKDGLKYKTCFKCGDFATEVINANGHNIVDGLCTVCGQAEIYESLHPYADNEDDTVVIRKVGAKRIAVTFSANTETTLPDYICIYNADGEELGKYTGTQLSGKQIVIEGDAVKIRLVSDYCDSSYGYKVSDVKTVYGDCSHNSSSVRNEKNATCGAPGYTGDVCCDECFEILEQGDVIPSLAHNFNGEVCERCTFCKSCQKNHFGYTLKSDSSIEITAYNGLHQDADIPEKIEGKTVVSIGNDAFRNCMYLTSVSIPCSVTGISDSAFGGCDNLTDVYYKGFESSWVQVEIGENNEDILNAALHFKTANAVIDYEKNLIYTEMQNIERLAETLGIPDKYGIIANASHLYGTCRLFGTGSTVEVYYGDEKDGDFTLVVVGDVNGDSIADVLDASQVALAVGGNRQLEGVYKSAADLNFDGLVSVEDYQAIVNIAVA